jgi:hypothetical protein
LINLYQLTFKGDSDSQVLELGLKRDKNQAIYWIKRYIIRDNYYLEKNFVPLFP